MWPIIEKRSQGRITFISLELMASLILCWFNLTLVFRMQVFKLMLRAQGQEVFLEDNLCSLIFGSSSF